MNSDILLSVLSKVAEGGISPEEAAKDISGNGFSDMGDYKIDTGRRTRTGFDEIIYGRAKTTEQITKIANAYYAKDLNFICTGLSDVKISILEKTFSKFTFNKEAGIMKHIPNPAPRLGGSAAIITAGTSDLFIAREAEEILDICGADAKVYADIGVAGIHRFFRYKDEIEKADAIIVIAGMEGALASIAGGMFSKPVIAVPSSTGYGTALNGFTALFAMLTSCAAGVTVVNIDNGFGAAMAALRIIKLIGDKNEH